MSTTITRPPTHQLWCEHHKEDEGLGFCCTQEISVDGYRVELSDGTLDGEPGVYVYTLDAADCLTSDQARAFAAAITGLCDRAEAKWSASSSEGPQATVSIEGRQIAVRDAAGMLRGSFSGSSKHGVRPIAELLVALRVEAEGQR